MVNAVLHNPNRRKEFVSNLKEVIDRRKYLLSFNPSEQEITNIKITWIYPINWLKRESFYIGITSVWLQYGKVLREFDRASGRTDLTNPEDYV